MAKKTIIDEIATANGKYEYPEGFADGLIARQRSIERRLSNVLKYGDEGGLASMKRQRNSTQEELAKLQKNTDEARLLYACFMACETAPGHLRKYLFENLKMWLDEHGREINAQCSYWTASILPAVWTKGWENEDLCGWETSYQLEDLLPADGMEIGQKVLVPAYSEKLIEGTIVGYAYLRRELRTRSYNMLTRCGFFAIHYDVKYGSASYSHSTFPLKAIKFQAAMAI